MHEVIPPAALVGYNNGSAVMTLILPLGFFIVVMIALYFVFTRPHTVPGHRSISGARPVAPDSEAAPSIAVASPAGVGVVMLITRVARRPPARDGRRGG